MKKTIIIKSACIIFPLIALILEALPYGAVLVFKSPDGVSGIKTYSHFSLIPFGYGHITPFIIALLTCVLMILAVAGCVKYSEGIRKAAFALSCIAALLSFAPLLLGASYCSLSGVLISLMLILSAAMQLSAKKIM